MVWSRSCRTQRQIHTHGRESRRTHIQPSQLPLHGKLSWRAHGQTAGSTGERREPRPTYRDTDRSTRLEESLDVGSSLDKRLEVGDLSQLAEGVDGTVLNGNGKKGRQVGRVGRDDDQHEEPPRAANDPTRHRSGEQRGSKGGL